jgi:hypothetical protein
VLSRIVRAWKNEALTRRHLSFIELTYVAVANQPVLVRAEGATAGQVRDLVSYADSYGPLADELEALAHFVRYSVTAARNAAGLEALTTYSLAQRLSKLPHNAHLKPHVADMRRALGRGRKVTPEVAAQKAAIARRRRRRRWPRRWPGCRRRSRSPPPSSRSKVDLRARPERRARSCQRAALWRARRGEERWRQSRRCTRT